MPALLPFTFCQGTAWLFSHPRLVLLFGLLSTLVLSAEAAPLLFDLEAFTSGVSSPADLSRFNTSNVLTPGVYRVDVILNGQSLGRRPITFVNLDKQDAAQPCVSAQQLAELGVVLRNFEAGAEEDCLSLIHI